MRFIPTLMHGVLDYLVGALLLAAPWLFGFREGGAETIIPMVLGAMALVYSLLTNYELGVVKALSMKTHLTLDVLSGIFLAASPWIFSFNDRIYLPHLAIGIFESQPVL